MLSKLRVQHYKSLFDTEVDLEPLTVFIGPNGSGKSNICESLAILSRFLESLIKIGEDNQSSVNIFDHASRFISVNSRGIESKFWQGKLDYLSIDARTASQAENFFIIEDENNRLRRSRNILDLSIRLDYHQQTVSLKTSDNGDSGAQNQANLLRDFLVSRVYPDSPLASSLKRVSIYDFAPTALSMDVGNSDSMYRTGAGIAYSLVDILHNNRANFDELEERLVRLVPNIKRILLPRGESQSFELELIDRYSEHHIPASDISDGTLRILAFLTALYQEDTPSIICFEELENGVHPWLLHKMMELLKIVSTEGINGKPVQILITTHSPVLLDYVEPHQVRAVELDHEGKTQVHALPTDSVRFQKALEAYDGALSELWFTNVFGGNPV
jgi:predicted ATPase